MAENRATEAISPSLEAWRQFRKNRPAIAGLVLLGLIGVAVLYGSFLYGGDPYRIVAAPLTPPGVRQRVMIAMAISCRPRLLIADEPTTALDVTVQAQVFDLIRDIQEQFGVAVVLITHDMGAIAEMADRVAVMYAGRVIEQGSADEILDNPLHPYTRGLIDCVPILGCNAGDMAQPKPLTEIPGVVPPLHLLGEGCAFAGRCSRAQARCHAESPALHDLGMSRVACHYPLDGEHPTA